MDTSKITWFIQNEENDFVASNSYTAEGSYIPGDYLIKNLQIWNNYNGNKDIEDAKNISLMLSFKNYEDNFLLNLIEVSIENGEYKKLKIDMNKGSITLGDLTGNSNTGQSNSTNCKNIRMKIGPIPQNIKTDFKTLIFYINIDSKEAIDDIQEQAMENVITNTLLNVDKTFVTESDRIILASANSYADQQIKQVLEKIIGSSSENFSTIKELANAINNNPNFAKEITNINNNLKQKVSTLEYLTNGFDSNIKKYVDKTNDYTEETITEEEIQIIIDYIKGTLNLPY